MPQHMPQSHAPFALATGACREHEGLSVGVGQGLAHHLTEESGKGERESEHRQNKTERARDADRRQPVEGIAQQNDEQ